MPDAAPPVDAGNGAVEVWSDLLIDPWRRLIAELPSLAPAKLYQNIMSSLISGGHFALIANTVNQQATRAPELEEEIVTRVASYGKQLGRLIDAVDVLAKHVEPADPVEREALAELTNLAAEIKTARDKYADDHLEQILKSIRRLGRPDHVDHAALQQIKSLVDRLDRQP